MDAMDGVIGQPCEHFPQIRFRVDPVELGGTQQTINSGGAFASGIGSGKQKVFAPQRDDAQGAFSGVIVDLKLAVLAVTAQNRMPQ